MLSRIQIQKSFSRFLIGFMLITEFLTPFSTIKKLTYAAPTLSISKALASGTPNPIATGQEFDYEITWGCLGSVSPADDCFNMYISDTLPADISYVNAAFSYPVTAVTASGQNLRIDFAPTVTAGSVGSFTLRAKFPAGSTPDNTTVNNTAVIHADGVAPVTSNSVSIISDATDKFIISKSITGTGAVDNLTVYRIQSCPAGGVGQTYNNSTGYLFPTNLSIVDTLPTGATYVSASPAPTSISGSDVIWNMPGLTNNAGSNPDWSSGCFYHSVTVDFPSLNVSNFTGANKTNTATAYYTPSGSTPTSQVATASHRLPAPIYSPGHFTKTANVSSYIGDGYSAELQITNTGTTTLDYEIVDFIPSEVSFYFFKNNTYLVSAEYQKNGVNTWIPGVSVNSPSGVAVAGPTDFPGWNSGDYVSAIRLHYNDVPANQTVYTLIQGTHVNPGTDGNSYSLPHTFTNTGTLNISTSDGTYVETQVSSWDTQLVVPPRIFNPGNIKCVADVNGNCLTNQTYAPGNTGYYSLKFINDGFGITLAEQAPMYNPTYVDLLPAELELVNVPGDFTYTYSAGIIGRNPGNNDCKPDITVIPDYQSTGRTMLVFSWAGKNPVCRIPTSESIKVANIKFRVRDGAAPGTVMNRATAINSENPPTDEKRGGDSWHELCVPPPSYTTLSEYTIVNGASGGLIAGIPVSSDYFCFTKDVSYVNGETFDISNSFQMDSKKCVQGQLDPQEYCSGDQNVARTLRNGTVTWTNKVTNVGNISVTGLTMVDILPFPGNLGVGNPVDLGTTWQPIFSGAVSLSGAPSGTTVYYSTEVNPCRPEIVSSPGCITMTTITGTTPGAGEWSDVMPADPSTIKSIKIDFGSNIISGGESISISYTMVAPTNAPFSSGGADTRPATLDDTNVAWNSFGWFATRLSDSTIQSSAPTRVGIEVPSVPVFMMGDYVWNDTNQNGQQDEGTGAGINNVLVSLYSDIDGNTGTTADQSIVGTGLTANDISGSPGYYSFSGLVDGYYFVRFETPLGYTDTSPSNTGSDISDSDGLAIVGQTYLETPIYHLTTDNLTVDQGFYTVAPPASGSLGDIVWYDTNVDGAQNNGEMGISGVTVTLSGMTFTGVSVNVMTTTDGSGYYLFPTVYSGSYTVTTNISGYLPTYDLDGTSSVSTTNTTLAEGQNRTDVDFGYVQNTAPTINTPAPVSLTCGQAGLAMNFSGSGSPNATISLYRSPSVLIATATVDASGNWSVTPGYAFGVNDIVSITSTLAGDMTNGSNTASVSITPATGCAIGSIGDTVWYDMNGNGLQDGSETGMSGVILTLSGLTDTGMIVNTTTTTNSAGYYMFSNVYSGSYTISTNVGGSYIATYDLDGTSNVSTADAALAEGQNRTDVDFGYTLPLGSLAGTVWEDTNANGTIDVGEPRLSGVTVTLSGMTTTTDGAGNYSFTGLSAGTYTITITTPPNGMNQTYDTNGTGTANTTLESLAVGQNKVNVNFGYVAPVAPPPPVLTGSLGDIVWYDANSNSIQDGTEVGMSGVTVTLSGLTLSGQTVSRTTTTSSTGGYLFSSLLAGTYTVTTNVGGSYIATYDLDGTGSRNTTTTSLTAGQNRTDVDFGYVMPPPPSLGGLTGKVWNDADGNMSIGTEPGISGVTVSLSLSGITIGTTVTDASGNYSFTGLTLGGLYTVTLTTPPSGMRETYDTNGINTPHTTLATITLGSTTNNVDFGYMTTLMTSAPIVTGPGGGGGGGSMGSAPMAGSILSTQWSAPMVQTITPTVNPLDTIPKIDPVIDFYLDNPFTNGSLNFILPGKLPQTGKKKKVGVYTAPSTYLHKYASVDVAPTDIAPWVEDLPEIDRNRDRYVVIPVAGIISPINDIGENTSDFSTLISGKEIKVNPYLKTGVARYPNSAVPGAPGNLVIFGHSSYLTNDDGRYRTIFQTLIGMPTGTEVWVYEKRGEGTYERYRYSVDMSYNVLPTDTSVLTPGIGENITLITCTPIGGIAGRWVIKGQRIFENGDACNYTDVYGEKQSGMYYAGSCRSTDTLIARTGTEKNLYKNFLYHYTTEDVDRGNLMRYMADRYPRFMDINSELKILLEDISKSGK